MKTANLDIKKKMLLAEKAMRPYQEQIESEDGLLVLMNIQAFAFLIHAGHLKETDMDKLVKDVAALIKIPEYALRLHANLTMALVGLAGQDIQPKKGTNNG